MKTKSPQLDWREGRRRRACDANRPAWAWRGVAEVLRRAFGVTDHPAHVSRLLHAVRQSVQRPRTQAAQRDAAAIAAWWRERWPALEKKRPTKGGPLSG